MASLLQWTLLLLAGSTMCFANAPTRISGGEDSSVQQYTSVVQVDFLNGIFWTQSCGGAVLTSSFILSAAKCFSGLFSLPVFRRIRAGTSERQSGGEIAYVQQAFIHMNYNSSSLEADVAVVQLVSPLPYSDVITQGAIIAVNTVLPDDLPVTQIGWGATSAEDSSSKVLQAAEVVTINSQVCSEQLEQYISVNKICTGSLSEKRAACSGDIGGPVYYGDIIVGIISAANGCTDNDLPDVNTAVASYTDWIIGQTLNM